jgi:hypothetical protein
VDEECAIGIVSWQGLGRFVEIQGGQLAAMPLGDMF